MTFAENLRRLRVEHFLSQRELARQAGLHAVTVVRLEAGTRAPSTRSVRALATALGVKPGDLTTPEEVAELRRVLLSNSPATAMDEPDPGEG
jgi:transcriptional regulator with XRE-family HTH domain